MFNLFRKRRKAKTEQEFLKQFLKSGYKFLVKVHFPVLVYPELPTEPKHMSWQEQQQYILDNLIPKSFRENFETEYSQDSLAFELIEQGKNGDINLTKRFLLVNQYLQVQRKVYFPSKELKKTNFRLGDFNTFRQYLDDTPKEILKSTLEAIYEVFPDSKVIWDKCEGSSTDLKINKLLETLDEVHPFNHLDRMYDAEKNWELLQPEEGSFLLVGINSTALIESLAKRKLEIEKIKV